MSDRDKTHTEPIGCDGGGAESQDLRHLSEPCHRIGIAIPVHLHMRANARHSSAGAETAWHGSSRQAQACPKSGTRL